MSGVSTIVLGGTGYVASAFPHLAPLYPDEQFKSQQQIEALLRAERAPAILAAAPHGVSAGLIDSLLATAEKAGNAPRVVDISADFRYATAAAYETVYGHPHGAPARIAQFTCAVPEHLRELKTPHVAHPGCFATTILLAAVPLLALDLVEPQLFVAATTGSTGSGRKPVEGTHHPLRHGDLYAYNALTHRHSAEIVACAQAASGAAAHFAFVPHSGPYARGIHATVQAVLRRPLDTAALLARLTDFYAHSPLVQVGASPPRLKEVVASCYARLGAVSDGRTLAVMSVADNLNKGAAGGALQWMNRLQGFPETLGLTAAAAGWT